VLLKLGEDVLGVKQPSSTTFSLKKVMIGMVIIEAIHGMMRQRIVRIVIKEYFYEEE
jgi:hypothetical protein